MMGRKSISCHNAWCHNGALCQHCRDLQPKEDPKLEEPFRLEGKLEPEAMGNTQYAATLSLAISMKRIADAVCGDDKNSGIAHAIWDISQRPQ